VTPAVAPVALARACRLGLGGNAHLDHLRWLLIRRSISHPISRC